jgi:glutaredoxin
VAVLFMVGCAAGGFWLFSYVRSSPTPVAASAEHDGRPAWLRAIVGLLEPASVELESVKVATDAGGTAYNLPTGKMVAKEPVPEKKPAPSVRVEKKYGGEIQRKPGGRVALKLHGEPTQAAKERAESKRKAARQEAESKRKLAREEEETRQRRRRLDEQVRGLERKKAQGQVRVLMYATSWCGACRAARAWFARKRITYVEKDIEKDPAAAQAMRRLNPRGGVPTIVINGQVMVGFSPAAVQSAMLRR